MSKIKKGRKEREVERTELEGREKKGIEVKGVSERKEREME